jgi:hypothetical protein
MAPLNLNQVNNANDTTSLECPNPADPTLFVNNLSVAGYGGPDQLQPDAILTQTNSGIGCNALANQNAAIQGTSFGSFGVIGRSVKNSGVIGQNGALGGFSGSADPAVMGVASGPSGDGVSGVSTGPSTAGLRGSGPSGVVGISTDTSPRSNSVGVTGVGPFGVVGKTAATNNAAVIGVASGNSPGVWGQSGSASWPALEGFATGSNNGVRGVSIGPAALGSASNVFNVTNVGVVGFSSSGFGVVGIGSGTSASTAGGLFFDGLEVSGGTFLSGDVIVGGDFRVTGNKNVAVKHPDGSHRLFYCVESPESWFEDFGRARLVRGKAEVKLERTFAGFVRLDDYHVFLSPEGPSNGLYISRRTRKGFSVREHDGGKSATTFSYRLVARRKDLKIKRFKPVRLPVFKASFKTSDLLKRPNIPKLQPPATRQFAKLPTLPELPKNAERRSQK